MSDENSSLLTDGRDCSHDEGKDDCVHHCNFYEQYLNFRSRSERREFDENLALLGEEFTLEGLWKILKTRVLRVPRAGHLK